MKYLSVFTTLGDYTAAKNSQANPFDLPHVSLISATMEVKYDPWVAPQNEEPVVEG